MRTVLAYLVTPPVTADGPDGVRQNRRRTRVMAQMIVSVVVVGWLDYVLPWEMNMTLAYALIVLLATWFGSGPLGLTSALLCSVVAFFVNLPSHPYRTVIGLLLANLSRVAFLVCIAACMGAIRKRRESDGERIAMLEALRHMEKDIVRVAEHEQQRIGLDLHDGLCQELAAISCAARALAEDLQKRSQPDAKGATMIEEALRHAAQEARNMARGISPLHVDRIGLASALQEMVKGTRRLTGIAVEMTEASEVTVDDPEVAMNFYRIAQESVANAVRHSEATRVTVSLLGDSSRIELRVEDNGRGIDRNVLRISRGMGLRTLNYRAHSMGADLAINPGSDGGTIVRCCLSLQS